MSNAQPPGNSPCAAPTSYSQLNAITNELNFSHLQAGSREKQTDPDEEQFERHPKIEKTNDGILHPPVSSSFRRQEKHLPHLILEPPTPDHRQQQQNYQQNTPNASTSLYRQSSQTSSASGSTYPLPSSSFHSPSDISGDYRLDLTTSGSACAKGASRLCINRHYLTGDEQQLSERLQALRVSSPLPSSARSASISPVSSAAVSPIPPGNKKKKRKRRFNLRRLARRGNSNTSNTNSVNTITTNHHQQNASLSHPPNASHKSVTAQNSAGSVGGGGNFSRSSSGKRKYPTARSRNPFYSSLHEALSNGQLGSFHRLQLLMLNSGLLSIRPQAAAAILPQRPFDLSNGLFDVHLQLLRKYPVLLRAEFVQLDRAEGQHTQRQAGRPENNYKNAHKRLLPFDFNRVLLEQLPSEPGSDYINASHVDSLLRPNAYIAAAGPHEETAGDFWRMVWEHNSYVIVMLTKVLDFIRVMCCQYWPLDANKATIYDWIEVCLLAEEPLADFKIRTFRIRKISHAEWLQNRRKLGLEAEAAAAAMPNAPLPEPVGIVRPVPAEQEVKDAFEEERRLNPEPKPHNYRIVYQFHYEHWPVHTCPFADSLLQFRRRIRIYMGELNNGLNEVGPIVVHCSDGCGRTGAFLVIDANLEFLKEDNMYDIYGYAKSLRGLRKGMIESLDQYKFVYDCLEEANLNGQTWFTLGELTNKLRHKSIKDPETKMNEYQREYEKIVRLTPKFSIGDCAGGHRIENRAKNRDVCIIPPDSDRPYLSTFQSNDSTDFVNAVFIDGYTRPREYIVTEWPMQHTIPDCWSLIYDHDCNSVVVLANPEDHNKYPSFWPTEKEKKKKFGPVFTIECLAFNHYTNIKSWMFKINKKVVSLTELMSNVNREPKTTKFFQITCWPTGHKVPSSTNALVELMDMVERWRQKTSYGPVCVISADGKGRAGVYCAANVAIEQVVQHGEVDVFQAVKTVRRHRPQLVENMTEYKYCYDVILHYVLHYLNHEP